MEFFQGVVSTTESYAIAAAATGVLSAFIVRFALIRLGVMLEQRSNMVSSNLSATMGSLGRFAFWILVFGTLLIVYRILGDESSWDVPAVVAEYLPKLMLSIVFVGIGHLVGVLLRDISRASIGDAGFRQLATRIVYLIPLLVGIFLAIETIGVDVSFISTFGLIVVTVVLSTLGLAFALGAREHIANLIARRELSDYYAGDQVKVGDIEGTVVELTRTSLVLNTSIGQVTIPASRVANSITVRVLDEP